MVSLWSFARINFNGEYLSLHLQLWH